MVMSGGLYDNGFLLSFMLLYGVQRVFNEYIFLLQTNVMKNYQTLENKTKDDCMSFQGYTGTLTGTSEELCHCLTCYLLLGSKLSEVPCYNLLYFCPDEMQIISGRNYNSKVMDLIPYKSLTNFGSNSAVQRIVQHPFFSSYKYSV